MLLKAALITGGLAIVIFVLSRMFRRVSRENDEAFQRKVLRAAATFLKDRRPGEDVDSIAGALEKRVRTGEPSSRLGGVLRIELEVEKRSPTECLATVHVLFRTDSEVIRGRIEMGAVSWENLASDIRADFIKRNEERKIYVILDTGGEIRP